MAKVSGRGAGIGAAIAAAIGGMLIIARPVYVSHEGEVLRAYKDPIGVWTACSGDTRDVFPGQKFTKEECEERTNKILNEFGTKVAERNPDIIEFRYEWAAHSIFMANVGEGNYDRSSVKRLYELGQHRNACRAITKYKYAGGRVFQGLVNRRNGTEEKIGEAELCKVDAIPRDMGLNDA